MSPRSIIRPRRARGLVPASLAALLLLAAQSGPARAQTTPLPPAWTDALRALTPASRTGIIYDRVLPLAHLERLDGTAAAPAIDRATWRQAYDELRRASTAPRGPELATLDADVRAAIAGGVIPLVVLDRHYERVRPDALADGSLRMNAGGLELAGASPLVAARAVAAAAMAPRTYRGGDVTFALEQRWFFGDDDAADAPRAMTVDFADGRGPRAVRFGERERVHYTEAGPRTLTLAITRADGTQAETRIAFDVAALATPSPTDTLHVTATVPYHGLYGTGDAYVDLAPGHVTLTNPVVMIEGFDLDNSMNWDELYALLNRENLLEDLRADGFDPVVLNFTDATVPIEENGLLVAALVGASMGALCSRYGLAYLETHGVTHRVRTWISFDGPNAGADIPLGLQHWINFFAGQSTSAATFLSELQRPAAREMLINHFSATASTAAHAAPERDSLAASLASVGQYPTLTRRVAIANGSGTAQTQGFVAGAQVIRYEYSNALVAITGDVWALGNVVSQQVFNGKIRIVFSTTTQGVTIGGSPPWDGAPGGSRASFTELDTTAAPYGDIVALYPSHCFIPTIGSLALATTNPFFNVSTAADPLAMSPFDAIYWPEDNQEHVLITPQNAVWVKREIEQGVVGVGGGGAGARGVATLECAPSPFLGVAHLAFTLPSSGHADVRIYALDGREVRALVHEALAAGTHAAVWDGRDARGARVPAGVYFARLTTPDARRTRKIVKLN